MKNPTSSLCLAMSLTLTVIAIPALTGCNREMTDRDQRPGERTAGEAIDDKTLTSRVKSALADNAEYKFSDVAVSAFKGTVQLSGFVNVEAQKNRAGEIAKSVPGVKEVENKITVK